jgi:hypothetical protein
MGKIRKKTVVFSPAQIAACSLVIGALAIDKSLKFFCRQLGLMYLGEACNLCWDDRLSGERVPFLRLRLQALLEKYQLSFGLDSVASGWVAPYWADDDWNRLMSRLVTTMPNIPHWIKEEYAVDGFASVGSMLQNLSCATPTTRRHLQSSIGVKCFALFRAGMVVPRDWRPVEVTSVERPVTKNKKVLERSVGAIGLPTRAVNALAAGRIVTIGELIAHSAKQLHRLKGLGRKTLDNLKERLSEFGLSLASDRLQTQ